jgi:hypothetical protein
MKKLNLANPGEKPSGFVADLTLVTAAVVAVVSEVASYDIPGSLLVLAALVVKLVDKYYVQPKSKAVFEAAFPAP